MKLDVDGNGSTPVTYGVTSIPTLLLFKGGALVEQIKSAVPKQRIVDTFRTWWNRDHHLKIRWGSVYDGPPTSQNGTDFSAL